MTDAPNNTPEPGGRNARIPADIWPIRSAVAMAEGVEICRKSGQMGLITGPSGTGKTTAARATLAALAGAEVEAHYVSMTRAHDALLAGLVRIGKAIGAHVLATMGTAEAYEAVTDHIASYWPHGSVLLLDEAQYMSAPLIDGLRDMSDELRSRRRARGIVMVGTPDLAARINGRAGGRSKQFDPLRGRLYMDSIDELSGEDFETIASHYDLPGKQGAELMARIGTGRGGLHHVGRVIPVAEHIAGSGKPLSLGVLRVAAQGLGVAQ